jgi:hypothetical protein
MLLDSKLDLEETTGATLALTTAKIISLQSGQNLWHTKLMYGTISSAPYSLT